MIQRAHLQIRVITSILDSHSSIGDGLLAGTTRIMHLGHSDAS